MTVLWCIVNIDMYVHTHTREHLLLMVVGVYFLAMHGRHFVCAGVVFAS